MRLVIRGRELPGRQFGEHPDVHVGLQVRNAPVGLVPGDAREAAWETDVAVVDGPDGPGYRGEAVHGRPGERFLYLIWGSVDGDGFSMFRRAKLMLADIPAEVRGVPVVTVEIPLTMDDGSPRCARIPAAVLQWKAGE